MNRDPNWSRTLITGPYIRGLFPPLTLTSETYPTTRIMSVWTSSSQIIKILNQSGPSSSKKSQLFRGSTVSHFVRLLIFVLMMFIFPPCYTSRNPEKRKVSLEVSLNSWEVGPSVPSITSEIVDIESRPTLPTTSKVSKSSTETPETSHTNSTSV